MKKREGKKREKKRRTTSVSKTTRKPLLFPPPHPRSSPSSCAKYPILRHSPASWKALPSLADPTTPLDSPVATTSVFSLALHKEFGSTQTRFTRRAYKPSRTNYATLSNKGLDIRFRASPPLNAAGEARLSVVVNTRVHDGHKIAVGSALIEIHVHLLVARQPLSL